MMRHSLLWLGCVLVTPAWAADEPARPMDVPNMVERAEAAGLIHSYEGGWEYFVGGGAASFDCNGDRKPELFIAGGTAPAQLFINKSATGGEISFEQSDIGIAPNLLTSVSGAYPLDIDDDGYRDIVVLRLGRNLVLKGGPDCTFQNAANDFEFDGGREWTTAFSATFEPGLSFPTLAFGNYVDRSAPGSPWGTCHDNVLMRPQPGIDTPSYSQLELLTPSHCTLSMTFTDWDRSGRRDLRVTNDRQYYRGGQEQLWRMEPGRAAREYTTSDGWRSVTIWGMGIATADLDADGLPEYALTSMGDTKLQTLDDEADEGSPVYRDIAFERGATAHRPYTGEAVKPSTGWHAEFADFNNDGRNDLFIAKGNVEQMPEFAAFDPDNMLLGNHTGGFVEAGDRAGIALDTKGRGAIIDDFNHDGMLDLMVVNRSQNVSLFQNTGAVTDGKPRMMGNWLAIELQQDGANRDGIGARIAVKSGNETRIRFVESGGGHASGKSGFIHVGLGVAERAQIRVQWPDGEWSAPYRVFANQFVVVKRDDEQARYWLPE